MRERETEKARERAREREREGERESVRARERPRRQALVHVERHAEWKGAERECRYVRKGEQAESRKP